MSGRRESGDEYRMTDAAGRRQTRTGALTFC
jgi:hypothetical protein